MPTEITLTITCQCSRGVHKAGSSVGLITYQPLTRDFLERKMAEHFVRFAEANDCDHAFGTITDSDGNPVLITPPRRE